MRVSAIRCWNRVYAGAAYVTAYGGPECIEYREIPNLKQQLGEGQVLLRHAFAGVNFLDTYYRSGLYKEPGVNPPFIVGNEGSAAVIAVGAGVDPSMVGRRVAFYRSLQGSYTTFSVARSSDLFAIPDGVTDRDAAAVLLQGCTAHYLVEDCYKVSPQSVVLVHAAAGGTGLLITQLCANRGATVIGLCGGKNKADTSLSFGRASHVIDYVENPNWEERVLSICKSLNRDGVDVVYDGVGKATFERSCSVLRRRGSMVTFGNASGAVPPIAPLLLTKYGSISLQRPKLDHFMDSDSGEGPTRVAAVMDDLKSKRLRVMIAKEFLLRDAGAAHVLLESKQSIGKIVINCTE